MKRFIIVKTSKANSKLTLEDGYSGPACDDADIEPAKVYHSIEEAERDSRKLSKVNPSGFTVVEIRGGA